MKHPTRAAALRWLPFLLAIALAASIAACGGNGGPQERSLDIHVAFDGDDASMDPSTIQVKQDDMVTLNLQADKPGLFHLHGYDLAEMTGPDEPAQIDFEADATGRFEIEYHMGPGGEGESEHSHDEDSHGDEDDQAKTEFRLGYLEVLP